MWSRHGSFAAVAATLALAGASAGCMNGGARDPVVAGVPALAPNEARYDVRTRDRSIGTVQVTSTGAYLADVAGEQRAVIAVTLEVRNDGDAPVTVDPDELRVNVEASAARYEDLRAAGSSGALEVAPARSANLRAHFTLPAGVSPDDIRRFGIEWTLRESGGAVAYRLSTPFVQTASGAAFADAARAPAPQPYRYAYGGVWYDSRAHVWVGPHHPFVFVPYGGYYGHQNAAGHFGGYSHGPALHGPVHHGPVHHGGAFHGGGHQGGAHHGGGHHGGGHHAP